MNMTGSSRDGERETGVEETLMTHFSRFKVYSLLTYRVNGRKKHVTGLKTTT